MWTQIAWRSNLSIDECEQRLGNMPKRTLLLTTARQPFVVTRTSGRMFWLFLAGRPMQLLGAPHFHGFLVDKHKGTEIRGRLFPAPLTQVAFFLGIFLVVPILMSSLAVFRGVVVPPALMFGPVALLVICVAVAAAGRRSGRLGSTLIASSIEDGFEAHLEEQGGRLVGRGSHHARPRVPSDQ